MINVRSFIGFLLLILTATACQEGAVVFAPTPLPPDLSPLQYDHPSGAFSIRVPRDWALYEQATDSFAGAAFTPPGVHSAPLAIGAIRTDTQTDILALINQYQNVTRPDAMRYDEQDRQAMGDGSWRLIGLYRAPGDTFQQVNTFFQRVEDTLIIAEIRLPDDQTRIQQLETAVNTLQISTANSLNPTDVGTLVFTGGADVRVMNVNAWTTPNGVYYITGEVANFSPVTVRDVAISASLLDDGGTEQANASDRVMGHHIAPGSFAPFSLRFGAGQPPSATRFIIDISGGQDAPFPANDALLQWEDRTSITDEGHLLVMGTVFNQSPQTVHSPKAVITVFDANQRVIAAGFVDIDAEALAPNATADFALRIQEIGGVPANYIVSLQALGQPAP